MIKIKNIINRPLQVTVGLCSLLLVLMLGCKSDNDALLDDFFEFPETMTVRFGETFEIGNLKGGKDVMVVPAAVADLTYDYSMEKLVDCGGGEFKAKGVGETEVKILKASGELVRTVKVNILPPYELKDIPNDQITLKKNETFELLDITGDIDMQYGDWERIYKFTSSNWNVVRVENQGTVRAVGVGECEVRASYGSVNKVFKVTVDYPYSYEITILSGEIKKFSDIITDPEADQRLVSQNEQVVYAGSKDFQGRKAGTTRLTNTNTCIRVTVSSGPITDLFDINELPPYGVLTVVNVKEDMAPKYGEPEEYETPAGLYVLSYKNFGKTEAIEFYFQKNSLNLNGSAFKYINIKTGKPSDQVLAWVFNNFRFDPSYSKVTDFWSDLWTIRATDDSWSTLTLKR